jgi:hypothetical protein
MNLNTPLGSHISTYERRSLMSMDTTVITHALGCGGFRR